MGRFTFYILFLNLIAFKAPAQSDSWRDVQTNKKGTLTCYWNDAYPFIYSYRDDEPAGMEVDIMNGFVRYLKKSHQIDLTLKWKRINTFGATFDHIASSNAYEVGVSSFSLTEKRRKYVQNTPSYMPDISVIISNKDLPASYTVENFDNNFNNLTAITIKSSLYEQLLIDLKKERNLDFNIEYTHELTDIIENVSNNKYMFGYVDLATYLNFLHNENSIKREYHYTYKNSNGIGFILTKNSDWAPPFEEYFRTAEFENFVDKLIGVYFGKEVPHLIKNISTSLEITSYEEFLLLAKEREIQANELIESALRIQKETWFKKILFASMAVIIAIMVVIFILYRVKSKLSKRLNIQNEEIKKKNKKLFNLNREKNNLMGILSHDMRSPINQIEGLASILKLDNELPKEKELIVDQIIEVAKRSNSMIMKILDVESIDAHRLNLNIAKINIAPLLTKVIANFAKMASKKNIALKSHFEAENFIIEADEIYLIQVFENLISNAIKFSQANKNVSVLLKKEVDVVSIIIRDEGPGLTEDDKKKIFNKYQQLSAKPTGNEVSTGLGLSIVKKYILAMNGEINVESTYGKGTDFIVKFKLIDATNN